MSTVPVGRFAPSPTGRMHLGNAFAALLSWLSVRSRGGQWVLRIEDLDRGRCRPEHAARIEEDLRFLGLDWDRGGTSDAMYLQSNRSELYADALRKLEGLVYPCWCTRAEVLASSAPHESDGRVIYPGTCRGNTERAAECSGKPAALRINVPDREITFTDLHYGPRSVNLAEHCGDFVLRRSDGGWAYQLAVVVDDALMGITEVVRGRDLLLSAAQQIFLYEALGYKPPVFCHFPLLCNAAGQRLSKRDSSLDMGALRASFTAEQIVGGLAFLAGLTPCPQPCRAEELIPLFSWDKVPVEDIKCSPQGFFNKII